MLIEIGQNFKEILLAMVAMVGTVFGYYFGYKRGSADKVRSDESKTD